MAKRTDPAIVGIAGAADIRAAGRIHKQLQLALKKHAAVELNIGKAADFDLTFVQLVESARRTAAAAGKAICLSAPAPDALHDLLGRGGFLHDAASRAFWLNNAGGR